MRKGIITIVAVLCLAMTTPIIMPQQSLITV